MPANALVSDIHNTGNNPTACPRSCAERTTKRGLKALQKKRGGADSVPVRSHGRAPGQHARELSPEQLTELIEPIAA